MVIHFSHLKMNFYRLVKHINNLGVLNTDLLSCQHRKQFFLEKKFIIENLIT